MGELTAALNRAGLAIDDSPVAAPALAQLITRVSDGSVSGKTAKEEVFPAMWAGAGDADAIIAARGLRQLSDTSALERLVEQVLAERPTQVEQYRGADDKKRKKLLGGFMGPIMAASKGQANPAMVNEILQRKLSD